MSIMAENNNIMQKLLDKISELVEEVKENKGDKGKEEKTEAIPPDAASHHSFIQHPMPRLAMYQTDAVYTYAAGMNMPMQPIQPQLGATPSPVYQQPVQPIQYGPTPQPVGYQQPIQPYPPVYYYYPSNPGSRGRRGRRAWRPRPYGYQ